MDSASSKYLVADVAEDILETFDVPRKVAEEHAVGIVSLMDSHCSKVSRSDAFSHVVRLYGHKLPWRSEAQHEQWLADKQAAVAGYNAYLDSARGSPFKKW